MKKLIYAFIMGVMLCACVAKPVPVIETVNAAEVIDSLGLDSLCDTVVVDSVSVDSIEVL